ncbi:MAG: hypothetical protein WBL45_05170 [Solirubrobacterales bacterium]
MIGTYAAVLAVSGASMAIGQAAIGLSGVRRWSWLAPAVGLALVCAVCWGTVRLPGGGTTSAIVVLCLVIASVAYLWGRVEGGEEALRVGLPVALAALVAASLPFLVEGHFGILGTGFNPDMSQHLLATDRLAGDQGSQLLEQGYPLGPHAVVVALNKGLGIGLVQGFGGLTVAVAILASLTALAAFSTLRPAPRTAGALLVGFAYLVASYFAQGAFKETMQALFVLAFALGLREAGRSWVDLPLRFLPAALIAVGSVYVYSFAGLIWLVGTAVLWAAAELVRGGRRLSLRPVLLAVLVFAVLVAPEISRMIDFQRFETFDPTGPGLGNLFGQVSPFEALGIWPSGDFRLAPGDGAVPAIGYYLGVAFALALLIYGIWRCWRERETAILAGLGAAAVVYVAARTGGTPYTAAKAIEVASPLVALTILVPLLAEVNGRLSNPMGDKSAHRAVRAPLGWVAFVAAAGACSVLALANAPVGPVSYSPNLTELRPLIADDSTLVLAPDHLLADEHGTPYVTWELRGGRVCIKAESEAGSAPPPGVRFIVTEGERSQPPYSRLRVHRVSPPYVLWEATGPIASQSPCPLIAVRQARQAPAR